MSVSANSDKSNGNVAPPSVSHESGLYYKEQVVTLTSNTPGTQIYYTTDGSIPSKNSTLYSGPIEVNEDLTIKALAVRGNGNSQAHNRNNENIPVK